MTKAPPRPSMSKARRARIFAAHGGVCGLTGQKIGVNEPYEIEHRIPWSISFDDSDDNLYPVLIEPHKIKTAKDVKDSAKCKRMAGEKGQWAKRQKRGYGLIKSAGFQKPTEKRKWPSRPWEKKT